MKKIFYAAAFTLSLLATSGFAGQDTTQTKEKKKAYWVRNKKTAPAASGQSGNPNVGTTATGNNAGTGQTNAGASDGTTNGSNNMAGNTGRTRRHHQKN